MPDPRSPWQPHGVHGASRVVDHGAFRWTDTGWQAPPLASGLVYELHVGTFTPAGTFDGAIERLGELADLGVTHAELMPVNAFLYFTDHEDPDLGRAVSEGRRNEFREFGWEPAGVPDPQAPETFERSRLDWSERERERHRAILEWHRALIRLRLETGLTDGRLDRVRVRFDEADRWLVMERGAVTVACNLAARDQRVPLGDGWAGEMLLGSEPHIKVGAGAVDLPGESVAILGS